MDYFKVIKSYLEENNCTKALANLHLDADTILKASLDSNLCCSNSSFLFVYLEQAASFLSFSLNRLCKSPNQSIDGSIQRLSINAAPVGTFKKCLMNAAGTLIMIVYDKSLSAIELPSKWGKYDQYNGGSINTICKCIKFNLPTTVGIIDAIWHTKSDSNWIVSMTSDNFLRVFNCEHMKKPIKEYHLQNIFFTNFDEKHMNSDSMMKCINIDMGVKFTYNGKPAYPIYVLKPNGQIECLIDYELSKNFEFLGELKLLPSSELLNDLEIASFICLPSYPNCLVVLLKSFVVYHCLFMPKNKYKISDDYNSENDDADYNNEAILYIFESIQLNETNSIQLLKDESNSSRYFLFHETGAHSIYVPWLEHLQISFLNKCKNADTIEFDDFKQSEINHVISTQPIADKKSSSHLIGLTILHGFGHTSSMLVGLNNFGTFVCSNIQIGSNYEKLKNTDSKEDCIPASEEFANYISSILKRQTNLPLLSAENVPNLSDAEMSKFANQVINLIRFEYIERQKLALIEFQKRSKLLKQQEQMQFDIVKEINAKNELLEKKKNELLLKFENYTSKQTKLKDDIERCLNKLLIKRAIPMNENEKEIKKKLAAIKENLKSYDVQIKDNQQMIDRNNVLHVIKQEATCNEEAVDYEQIKSLIKNEADKIKLLVLKVDKLKAAVKL